MRNAANDLRGMLAARILALTGAVLASILFSIGVPSAGMVATPGSTYDRAAYIYDVPVLLSLQSAVATNARGAGASLVAASSGLSAIVEDCSAAAKSEDGLVNLASEGRTTHILDGDATGGGHAWPGLPGKTPFPASWSRGQIMHAISDIVTDPAAWENVQYQGGRAVLYGTRDGVDIKVVVNRSTGDIITGHPINLPRNP